MKSYKTLNEAIAAAELQLNSKVGIESAEFQEVEFYSKNDPANTDTFTCYVEDGNNRFCKNGGEVITKKIITTFVIAWQQNTNKVRYHVTGEKNGTAVAESATFFDSEEEAQAHIDENEYLNCYVEEIEISN